MSAMPSRPRGMYFEEFQTGQTIVTAGRTISEADIINFAGLTGDYNRIHTDAEYSREGAFGQRVAHGLLVLSIASGLAVRTGIMEDTVMMFREVTEWKFVKPVFIGDTIHAELQVGETKEMRRIGGGSVTINVSVLNQRGEVVEKGCWTVLVASKKE